MTAQDSQDRKGLGAGWYASAALVVAVVAALVWILLTRDQGTTTTPVITSSSTPATAATPAVSVSSPSIAASTSVPTGSTPSQPTGWPDTGCNGTSGSTGSPLEPLVRQVTWEPFLSAAIPVSTELGPKVVKSPLRQCFQHSPAGAVMAAANITYALATPSGGRQVAEKQYLAGPGRDDVIASLRGASDSPAEIVGYRLAGCGPAACNVQLAYFGQGMYATGLIPMVWHEGDWWVDGSRKLPDPGLTSGLPRGFTPWGSS